MKVKLSPVIWDRFGCESTEIRDFVRRCLFLGYGLHVITDWLQDHKTAEGMIRYADIIETSNFMGITVHDTIEKES